MAGNARFLRRFGRFLENPEIAYRARDADAFSTALAPGSVALTGVEQVLSLTNNGELREWRAGPGGNQAELT